MTFTCPITGDVVEVSEDANMVVIDHPQLGRYSLDTATFHKLELDARIKERLARWIGECHLVGMDAPLVSVEVIQFFDRLADLESDTGTWHELREEMRMEDANRLWQKLRLEWNYNSNHIEGNTLTYGETELLFLFDRTAGGHPLRHYEEMKAHDAAIEHIRRLAKDERILSEKDIRELNQILLKEPFWKSAITSVGEPTRKLIVPGQYKTMPNEVLTATGEPHRYAEPEETPALMQKWVEDFRRDLQRCAYPLPLFLAESHWRFVHIHPFDDGNGRTARLLTNYTLLRKKLPPIVIMNEDRDRYFSGLQHADQGHILPLADFMLENVLDSLKLAIRAAKGESIRESRDIEKEASLFAQRMRGPGPKISDVEKLDQVVHLHVRSTLDQLKDGLKPLATLFSSATQSSGVKTRSVNISIGGGNAFSARNWKQTKQKYITLPGFQLETDPQVELREEYRFNGYTGRGNGRFSLVLAVVWKLGDEGFSREIGINGHQILDQIFYVRYSEIGSRDGNVDRTVEAICRHMMDEIENQSQKRN